MLEAAPDHMLADPEKQLNHHLAVLREYAKWCLLREYPLPADSEQRKGQILQETFELADRLGITERDTVWLVFHGLFAESP